MAPHSVMARDLRVACGTAGYACPRNATTFMKEVWACNSARRRQEVAALALPGQAAGIRAAAAVAQYAPHFGALAAASVGCHHRKRIAPLPLGAQFATAAVWVTLEPLQCCSLSLRRRPGRERRRADKEEALCGKVQRCSVQLCEAPSLEVVAHDGVGIGVVARELVEATQAERHVLERVARRLLQGGPALHLGVVKPLQSVRHAPVAGALAARASHQPGLPPAEQQQCRRVLRGRLHAQLNVLHEALHLSWHLLVGLQVPILRRHRVRKVTAHKYRMAGHHDQVAELRKRMPH
mmetsp:Transcript_32923/g.83090  ORF Transcript_32923/g.83090 Transcript_32923/m.83090 type:complete len:294 (-) Transcript_32923:1318-2199(-)